LLEGWSERLYTETYTADAPAGALCGEWAEKLGLPEGITITCGAIDAHLGAVGGGVKPGSFVKVVGTSTCDMGVAIQDAIGGKQLQGICGQVDGSIVPGLVGLEAGQSAFGDIYAWFRDLVAWPIQQSDLPDTDKEAATDSILEKLSEVASAIPAGQSSVLGLDWHNGRRSPDADPHVKGALTGLALGSDAPQVFRALVEATCFGSRAIQDCLESQGVEINEIVAVGGVAKKSPLVMQTMADVLNRRISVCESEQACALGAAIMASVACGIHSDVAAAQDAMSGTIGEVYAPDADAVSVYEYRYQAYRRLGAFVQVESS